MCTNCASLLARLFLGTAGASHCGTQQFNRTVSPFIHIHIHIHIRIRIRIHIMKSYPCSLNGVGASPCIHTICLHMIHRWTDRSMCSDWCAKFQKVDSDTSRMHQGGMIVHTLKGPSSLDHMGAIRSSKTWASVFTAHLNLGQKPILKCLCYMLHDSVDEYGGSYCRCVDAHKTA